MARNGDCPNCGAKWDEEETELQMCDACGYPDDMDDEHDSEDYD